MSILARTGRNGPERRLEQASWRLAFGLLIALSSVSSRAADPAGEFGELPPYHAEDPEAAPVTAGNVLENERFWPYRVGFVRPWKPEGLEQPLPVDISGVLVRLDSAQTARIDFGRDGIYDVPVAETDLIEMANRVRRGEVSKIAPNYVLTIATRLVDAAADPPRAIPFVEAADRRGFVSVFADPAMPGFGELLVSLKPLQERRDLLVVLFPQGERPKDREIWTQLRETEWPVPFVRDFLSGPYTDVLLPDGIEPPAVLLQTPEGRILFRAAWAPGVARALLAAVDAHLPADVAVTETTPPAD